MSLFICSQASNLQYAIIGVDNFTLPKQAIIWIKDNLVYWYKNAPVLNELKTDLNFAFATNILSYGTALLNLCWTRTTRMPAF